MTTAGVIMLVAMAGGIWLCMWNSFRVRPLTPEQERHMAERKAKVEAAVATRSNLHLHTLVKPERVNASSIFGLNQTKELERWNHQCAYCRTDVQQGGNLEWDHVMPIHLWGANHVSNIVPSCRRCNRRKGAMHPQKWLDKISNPLRPITWERANRIDFAEMQTSELERLVEDVPTILHYALRSGGKWVKRGKKYGRYHKRGPDNLVFVFPRKVQAERDYLIEMSRSAEAELATR